MSEPPASLDHHNRRVDRYARDDGHTRPWKDGMKRIYGPRTLLAIKKHEILNWLLPLSQYIDHILRKLTAQEGRNGR